MKHGLWLLPLLASCGCWFDGELKSRHTTVPEQLDDGWEIGTPEDVGLNPDTLVGIHETLLEPDRFSGALAFLVVKDGLLVFETYLSNPADRDHVHHLQSTTKSVTSLLFGIGRDQGWMPSVDTTLCSILVDDCVGLDSRRRSITLGDLLTMRSGIDFDNEVFGVEMWVDSPAHPARYILDKPLYAEPGTEWRYRDADPQLISYAMQALTGETEEHLGKRLLFDPLGIRDYYWDHGSAGETMGAHGLHLRPRDLAKIGELALERGVLGDQTLVSGEWLATSTSNQVDPVGEPRLGYGYYWWTVPEANGFSSWGHGGQYAFVVPEQRLVMVLISHPDTSDEFIHGTRLTQFVDLTRPLWERP